jgi:acetyl-CoA carboxylase biotin carboxyl carrier protein
MLNKKLEELIAFAESTDLQEVLWEKKGALVSFRRSAPVDKSPKRAMTAPDGSAPLEPPVSPEPLMIKSTMVGTFFRSDSPNRPPLVVEGTIVTGGQPVAAIEAMKIMKDVLAPTPCRIVKALVANGHPVEYGQPLFEVELSPEEPANV